jgi:hypothetical protein
MATDPEVLTNLTVLKRGNGATPEVFTAVPGVFNITAPKPTRPKIPLTDLLDTAVRHKLGIRDNGDVQIQYHWMPTDATQQGLENDDAAGTLRNFQLSYPDENNVAGAGGTDAFAAYVVVGREPYAVNGVQSRMATISISGPITES